MPASDSANRGRSVGSYLRESRESRGITLEEAARVTRIGKNYLSALEADMFDTLPSIAYAKGFLRAYAAFLGLSGDEIVATYERVSSPVSTHVVAGKGEPDASGPGKVTASRRGRLIVPLILLALVVATAYIFGEKETTQDKASPSTAASPAARVTAPALPPRSSARRHQETGDAPADRDQGDVRQVNAPSGGDGIVLKLKVNQDGWLNITIDDTISQQYELKAGDLIEWKGEKVFALDLGNPGGIEAELNGKPLKPFGESGKPAHVVLKAEGAAP